MRSRLPECVGFFELCVRQCTRISDWLRAVKRQSNVNRYLLTIPWENFCVLRAVGKMENAEEEGKEKAMYSLNVPAAKAEKYSKGKTDCDLVAFRK